MFNINSLFQSIDKKVLKFKTENFSIEEDSSLGEQVVEVLKSFKVDVEHIETEVGPVITNIYIKPKLGVRVTDVEVLDDDLRVALGVDGVNIQIAPEKKAIAIEIPTIPRKKIPFGNILYSGTSNEILPATLGIDMRGNPINIDVADTPHLLIAGQTGSGKSVCLNAIITSLALNATPFDLQFLLIDPKRVEFSLYNNLPNLIGGHVINEIDEAMQSLQWLVQEMERRNLILAKSKCRKLIDFKQKLMTGNIAEIPKELADNIPYIVAVIDEYADLMMRSEKELTECIMKLAQKARNVGIHLILATQRPSSKILTGDIKANIPTRIALKVASSVDSKTIIDYGGAEKLLGKGDMILKNSNGKEQRIHGCFLSDGEIEESAAYLKESFKDNVFRFNQSDVFDTPFEQYEKEVSQHGELGKIASECVTKIKEARIRDDLTEWLSEIKDIFINKLKIQMLPEYVNSVVNSCGNIFAQALMWAFYEYTDEFGNYPLAKKLVQEAFDNENSVEYKFIIRNLGKNEKIDKIFSSIVIKKISEATDSKNADEKMQAYSWLQLLKDVIVSWNGVDGRNELIYAHPEIFEDYIVELVNEGCCDDGLLGVVYDNLDLFKDLIIEWGLGYQNETAYWTIFKNPSIFKDAIIEELNKGAYDAIKTIIENISVFEDVFDKLNMNFIANDCSELFDKLIQRGNKYAKAIVYENPQEYQNFISDWTQNGDEKAKAIVYENPQEYQNFISDWTQNGDEKAKAIVCENPQDYLEIFAYLVRKGDEKAKAVVCENPQDYQEIFVDLVRKGDEKAKIILYEYPQRFIEALVYKARKKWDNEDAIMTIRNGCPNSHYMDPLVDWARSGDEKARNAICDYLNSVSCFLLEYERDYPNTVIEILNEKIEGFEDLVVKWAKEGDVRVDFVAYIKPNNILYNSDFRDVVVRKAKERDVFLAEYVIQNNFDEFDEKIAEMIKNGDEWAKEIVDHYLDSCNTNLCVNDNVKENFSWSNPYIKVCIVNLWEKNDEWSESIIQKCPRVFRELILECAKEDDDSRAKQIIYDNPRLFEGQILEYAKEYGDPCAKQIVYNNPGMYKELILKWAKEDKDPNAERSIRKNPQIFKNEVFSNPKVFFETIVLWAITNDDSVAREFICDNLELFKNLRVEEQQKDSEEKTKKSFCDLVVAWATEGFHKAKKIIHDNPSIFFTKISECASLPNESPSMFIDFIKDWALSGYKEAKYFALNNALSFKNVVVSLASSDDEIAENAKNIVYDNSRAFRNLIDSWAKCGDERARKIIEEREAKDSISREELWKEVLRNKGLTEDQMILRKFKFDRCLHSHMTKENMEVYAENLITRAKL